MVSWSTISRRQWFSQGSVILLPRAGLLRFLTPRRVQFRRTRHQTRASLFHMRTGAAGQRLLQRFQH